MEEWICLLAEEVLGVAGAGGDLGLMVELECLKVIMLLYALNYSY